MPKATLNDIVDRSFFELEDTLEKWELEADVSNIFAFAVCWGVKLPDGSVEVGTTTSSDFSDNLSSLLYKVSQTQEDLIGNK